MGGVARWGQRQVHTIEDWAWRWGIAQCCEQKEPYNNAHAVDWGAMSAEIEGKSGLGFTVNTAEETEAVLAEIGGQRLRCYTGGGADRIGARGY